MTRERMPRLIVLIFLAVHGLLLVHDLRDPQAYLNADRAPGRLEKIRIVFTPEADIAFEELNTQPVYAFLFPDRFREMGAAERIAALAAPGDYLPQGLFWAIGGRIAMILMQLALALAATFALWHLARLLGLGPAAASAAVLLYTFLPASLCQPHQLISEALFNPLVIIGLLGLVRTLEGEGGRLSWASGLLVLSAAVMVRYQLALLPLLLLATLWLSRRPDRSWLAATGIVLPLLLPLFWLGFMGLVTGTPAMGASNLDPGRNFAMLAARVMRLAGDQEVAVFPNTELSLREFLAVVVAHPAQFLSLKLSETTNLLLNPGLNILLGDYLGLDLFSFGRDGARIWVQARATEGLVGVVRTMLTQDPLWLASFLAGTAIWGLILLTSLAGAWRLLRAERPTAATKLLLGLYLVYSLAVVQLAVIRLGHRSSIEFLLAILAVAALTLPLARRQGHPVAATS